LMVMNLKEMKSAKIRSRTQKREIYWNKSDKQWTNKSVTRKGTPRTKNEKHMRIGQWLATMGIAVGWRRFRGWRKWRWRARQGGIEVFDKSEHWSMSNLEPARPTWISECDRSVGSDLVLFCQFLKPTKAFICKWSSAF
jgi:hypothetical protein